jgi:hypothetical protein
MIAYETRPETYRSADGQSGPIEVGSFESEANAAAGEDRIDFQLQGLKA